MADRDRPDGSQRRSLIALGVVVVLVRGRLAVGPRALRVGEIGRLPDVGAHQLRAPGHAGPLTADAAP